MKLGSYSHTPLYSRSILHGVPLFTAVTSTTRLWYPHETQLTVWNTVDRLKHSWPSETQLTVWNTVDRLKHSWPAETQLTGWNTVDRLKHSWPAETQLTVRNTVDRLKHFTCTCRLFSETLLNSEEIIYEKLKKHSDSEIRSSLLI
jgi:hypothetical protein